MKAICIAFSLLIALSAKAQVTAFDTPGADDLRQPDKIISLWSGDAPGLIKPVASQEKFDKVTGEFQSVSSPSLWIYLPKNPVENRPVIMICPGGGFGSLSMGMHVRNVVKLFNDQGIVVIGLKYRTNYGGNDYVTNSLMDCERGIRLIRFHACEWGIDPNKICVQGYSAGGTVVLNLLANFDAGNSASIDPVERFSSRPDYVALMCPWPNGHPATTYIINENPMPVFIASAKDDNVAPTAFAMEIAEAIKMKGGRVYFFIIPAGGHGAFHVGVSPPPGSEWPSALQIMFP